MLENLLAVLFLASPASGDTPAFAPSGKWSVEYAEATCLLTREFGTGAEKLTFGVQSNTLGGAPTIIVSRTPAKDIALAGTALVTFGSTGTPLPVFYMSAMSAANTQRIDRIYLGREMRRSLEGATTLSIVLSKRPIATLALPGMSAAMSALSVCDRNLAKTLGYDPTMLAAVVTPAVPNGISPGFAVRRDEADYVARGEVKRSTTALFTVGLDGRATGCRVVRPSGSERLDLRVCRIIESKARYVPAKDKSGTPIVSEQTLSADWKFEITEMRTTP